MKPRPRDPLLALARLGLTIAMAVSVGGAATSALAIPVIVVLRARVLAWLIGRGAPPDAIWAVVGLTALAAAASTLAFFFFRHLYRIVGSVGEGDPFVPVNAERLRAMGWIAIATHFLALPIGLGRWNQSLIERLNANVALSLSGLLLGVVLFVLARVFREGTRLRDEVEGTV